MVPNLKCCVLGCHTRPNQGVRFYRFPCNNPQISSIWKQRICQSGNIDFDILNDHVCELHFDYRCKTGNECALEEGSLPTLHLPSFGNLFSTGNAPFQMSANRIEEPSYTISIDTLSYHCRFCLRRGLLYEIEASTYRRKSFLSLIDLPPNVLPDNTQMNACLNCLKSIVIAHQLSVAVEHSNTILQLLLQHPKQSKVVSNTNFFDMKSELAFCNLILANSLSIKLEIEIEDKMIWANEDYEQKLFVTGEPTSPVAYANTQNIDEKYICIAENRDNFRKVHDSVTSDKQRQKEFHKSVAIIGEYTTGLSSEGIPDASKNSYSCVPMKNTDDNAEVNVSNNSNGSCVEDRQSDNEQAPESTSKAVNERTQKCGLCKFTTNYKANLALHKNLHLAGNATVNFCCQKCGKHYLLLRHFVRHNTIVHADEFTCKICDKPHASATELAVYNYSEHHHLPCDMFSKVLKSRHHTHMLDHKQGQTTFTAKYENPHWNDNDGVYVCHVCEWNTPSIDSFNAHMRTGKHVQSDKNSTIGSQELDMLKTDPVRNADDRYQCNECPKVFVKNQKYTNERRYKCSECLKTFSQKGSLNIHKRIHTNERPYKCSECLKTFSQKGSLDIHKRIHTYERPYKCSECLKTFSQKGSLDIHKRIHTYERPYKCSECLKTFSQKGSLEIHKRIHTNERPYKCFECLKTFSQKGNFDMHKRIHTNERPYKCSKCPKTFGDNSNFHRHNRTHTNERPYKCSECPTTFSNKSDFYIHRRIQTNERPYKCSECPKTFSRKDNCDMHKTIHTNERLYKCSECPKTFADKRNFIVHRRIHTNERPYKCFECLKSFSQKGSLDIHYRMHTNERPYKCSECPKTFADKSNFIVHRRIHTNERPFQCSECPKNFSRKDGLNIHKRIHTNEKPYKCSECPKTFSHKCNLVRHKRIHTSEIPYKC